MIYSVSLDGIFYFSTQLSTIYVFWTNRFDWVTHGWWYEPNREKDLLNTGISFVHKILEEVILGFWLVFRIVLDNPCFYHRTFASKRNPKIKKDKT